MTLSSAGTRPAMASNEMAADIPTTLLCGFLGSGKTTRINHLIHAGKLQDALFLINDFGRLNIDAELVESRQDNILRLTNGCACCGISGNLSVQLRDILGWSRRPGRLVFEASGIARPRPLMQLLDAARGYRLDESESLVDASAVERHLGDDAINEVFTAQIREVSRLRINRMNWLSDEHQASVLRRITAINPGARMTLETAPQGPPSAPSCPGSGTGPLTTQSVRFAHPIDVATLDMLLADAATELLRVKGLVIANDAARSRYLVQVAGGRMTRIATTAGRSQALVVIGHKGDALQALLDALHDL
ncbi:CobW family GTP-binding protein [Halomonas caseinilytica]|uniref:GTPase, G3E family n=1 Tax=Halomonas caseinilytica TaxID=438744 RepID=A0A1M6WNB8_9GAMM|nr:GTP-binding protein [Halomonas caseinilytica]SEM86755.1 GTPase, G3E family [Halomonas caseinilytica]SHK95136.1 GTPase, G3E family [Halomonas caseinilytica]